MHDSSAAVVFAVAGMLLPPDYAPEAKPADWPARFKTALRYDTSEWADGAIDELAQAVMDAVREYPAAGDEDLLRIERGLKYLDYDKHIAPWHHPLRRKLAVESVRWLVEDNLAHAGVPAAQRDRLVGQAQKLIESWKSELIKRHPQHAPVIEAAAENTISGIRSRAASTLAEDWKKPVSAFVLFDAKLAWPTARARVSKALAQRTQIAPDDMLAVSMISQGFYAALGPLNRESRRPTLPVSRRLRDAWNSFEEHRLEIGQYEQKQMRDFMHEKIRERSEQQIKRRQQTNEPLPPLS